MKIVQFEDLDIWKEARELCMLIKEICENDKFSKDYTLKNQILSSSGSIMDNIAEGFERGGNKEFIQFLFLQKDLVVKLGLKYIGLKIMDIYQLKKVKS